MVVPVTRWVRRALLVGLLTFTAAASGCSGDEPQAEERRVATTVSGRDCGKDVIDDWFVDGRVDGIYRLHCYDVAVDMLAQDDPRFTTIRDDLRRARSAAARGARSAAASDGFWSPTRKIACWGTGVTCRNLRGRGWFLSRASFELYR